VGVDMSDGVMDSTNQPTTSLVDIDFFDSFNKFKYVNSMSVSAQPEKLKSIPLRKTC
jgi:hypothetical protein